MSQMRRRDNFDVMYFKQLTLVVVVVVVTVCFKMSIKREEVVHDLEKVECILKKLIEEDVFVCVNRNNVDNVNDLNENVNRLNELKCKYMELYKSRLKVEKSWLQKIYEDNTTVEIIKEQELAEFIPPETKPARYETF